MIFLRNPICIRKCSNCGKEVKIFHKDRAQRKHIFCSKKCEGEYRKKNNKENAVCPICKRKFHIRPSSLHDGSIHCCSKECSIELRKIRMSGENNHQYGLKGELNSSYKGGERINVGGYILVYSPGNPFRNSDDYVLEHRLVAEKYLLNEENSVIINGEKYLKPEYVVHHIDGNRRNNEVSNLVVMTRNEHTQLHMNLRKNSK